MNRILILLLLWLPSHVFSATNLTHLTVSEDNFARSFFVLNLFVDHQQSLTIEDISSGKLPAKIAGSRFNIPIEDANYWFSFTLENRGNKAIKRVVLFDEPFLYNANIHYQLENGKWYSEENGLAVPLQQRLVPNRLPVFVVQLAPRESKKIYLMMNCKQDLLTVGISVKSPESYLLDEQFEVAGYWFFFGISLSILFYNLFLLFSLRDDLYLYYTAYCASFFVFVLMYSGYDLYFVTTATYHYDLVVSISVSVACLTLFIRKLLNSSKTLPYLDKVMLFIVALFLLQGLLTYIDISNYYYVVFIGLPATLSLFFIGLYAFYKRIVLSNYLVFGMSWHVLGLFAIAALNAGLIDNNFLSRYGFMIGSVIELFVFSLALAYRVKLLQEKKNRFQYELLDSEKKERKLLEVEIENRYQELANAQQKMASLQRVDTLTGLYNRFYFDDELTREWELMKEQRKPLAVILMEFHELALFSEIYGRPTGDYSLRLLAQTLVGCVAQDAEIVARYSGSRFAIIVPNINKNQTISLIHKIKASIELVKVPFKDSKTGLVEMLFVGDATVPERKASSTQFIDKLELTFRSKYGGS
ncbi:MAG: diguanylate cyclase [Psychromonas sp.]|nr:diguanylate cyclase [Alteromonadales bacterium]MCP5079599.1 diguanylate cyclase [Psychromonas sp.]